MTIEIRRVTSDEDREIVGHLTYEVYVEERRFDLGGVDHENRAMRAATSGMGKSSPSSSANGSVSITALWWQSTQ